MESLCFSQIQVASNGIVGIGGVPEPFSQVSVLTDSTLLMGIYSFVRHTENDVQIAVFGDAASSTPLNTGRAYGTYGTAGIMAESQIVRKLNNFFMMVSFFTVNRYFTSNSPISTLPVSV